MRLEITLLLCLTAANVFGYETTGFQAFIEVGYPKILLSKEPDGEKSGCLWYDGPRLDGKWKDFSFTFIPQDDGTIFIRFGPNGRDDIPCYYADIQVNGVPVDSSSGWNFSTSPGGKTGSVVSGPWLKLYHGYGVYRDLRVKKGVRMEVSMRARYGSVLEAYSDQLSSVTANLDEAAKAGSGLRGGALEAGRGLAQCLNDLTALSEMHLRVSVPPLSLDAVSLEALKAKTIELSKAYEAEAARQGETLCLYDRPKIRAEIKDKIIQAARLADKLKTACLLEFMFNAS